MVHYFLVIVVKICNNIPLPKLRTGDAKITSRTWYLSVVTNGKSPPRGPALPNCGLLHTLKKIQMEGRKHFKMRVIKD
jgi:hypothetical protein